ncbi:MAG: PKD domain-containing protein [bacterium]
MKTLFFVYLALFPILTYSQDVGLYEIKEISLTATGSYSSPYLQIPADNSTPGFVAGTFTNGQTIIKIDGYWDGGNTWRIRMAPTKIGQWTYSTSSADPGLNGKSGSFNCVASTSKGFKEINPDYPYSFRWSRTKEPVFFMGDCAWEYFRSNNSTANGMTYKRAQAEQYIDARAPKGINHIYTIIAGWGLGPAWYNEGGNPFINSSADQLNPAYFQEVDNRLMYANKKGIGVTLDMAEFCTGGWGTQEELRRFIRYCIARYSAYDVIWWPEDEYNDAEGKCISVAGWNDMGRIFMKWDPYSHIRSIHPVNHTDAFKGQDWLSYHCLQMSGSVSAQNSNIVSRRNDNRPVLSEEFGYVPWQSAQDATKDGWAIVIGGGFFSTGARHTYLAGGSRGYGFSLDYTDENMHYEHLSFMKDFFDKTDLQWWAMGPRNNLVNTGYCLAQPGVDYLVFLPSGGSVNLNLADASGTLTVEWLNIFTGSTQQAAPAQGSATRSFTSPSSGSWALRVTGSSANLPPVANATADSMTGVKPLLVNFDGSSSSDADGEIVLHTWDFGDGNNGLEAQVQHTFITGGTYTVRLVVSDDSNATDTSTLFIRVYDQAPPTAEFTPNPAGGAHSFPLQVNFDASASTGGDGSITTYIWDFGHGTPAETGTSPVTSHAYASAGTYYVVLRVVNSYNDTATAQHNLDFGDAPVKLQGWPLNLNKSGLKISPNPFNPSTDIAFYMHVSGSIMFKVYNSNGKLIETPVDKHMQAGMYTFNWNASYLPSGIYLMYAEIGNEVYRKKLVLCN